MWVGSLDVMGVVKGKGTEIIVIAVCTMHTVKSEDSPWWWLGPFFLFGVKCSWLGCQSLLALEATIGS